MKCEVVRRYAGPYLDSELDPATSFEIARHLEVCEACRARLEGEGVLERAVAKELSRPEPGDDAVWERALKGARAGKGAPRRALLAAAAAAALAAVAWIFLAGRAGLGENLRRDYLKYSQGRSPLEIASRDPREVEAFFRERMGLSFRVPTPSGWELVGGRKCFLRDVPAAFLLYRAGGRDVTTYVFRAEALERFPGAGALGEPLMDESDEVRVAALRVDRNVVGAAGVVRCRELLELCRAFQVP